MQVGMGKGYGESHGDIESSGAGDQSLDVLNHLSSAERVADYTK